MRIENFRDEFSKGFKESKDFRKKTLIGPRTDFKKWDRAVQSGMSGAYFLGHMVGDIVLDFNPDQFSGPDFIEGTVDDKGNFTPKK